MQSGEVYLVSLDPTIGREIQKTRPVVVVAAGDQSRLQLAVVVPVTRWQRRWDGHPFFVVLEAGSPRGLSKKSVADCFQLHALSHERFISKLGHLGEGELDRVKSAVALVLDIGPEHCQ